MSSHLAIEYFQKILREGGLELGVTQGCEQVIIQWSDDPIGAELEIEEGDGSVVRKRSRVLGESPSRSGIWVGTEIS